MKPQLVVLAAGVGSRYGGLKQLESVGPHGERLLDYSLYDAWRSGFRKVVLVIRRDWEPSFRKAGSEKVEDRIEVRYVHQELDRLPTGHSVPVERSKPWGTGHATLLAEAHIDEPFAVINADDYYGADAYRMMFDHLRRAGEGLTDDYAMVGYRLGDTLSEHGQVARGLCELDAQGRLLRIVERTRVFKTGGIIGFLDERGQVHPLRGDEIVSMNFWGFTPTVFTFLREQWEAFLRLHRADPQAEFYLPSAIDGLLARDLARVRILLSEGRWYGVTYRGDKPDLIRGIRELINQGVYPENLWE